MNRVESAVFSKAMGYMSSYLQNEDKIQVIEPLTCMIRLAMLAFKPRGTKICIYENSVYLQEPSLFQGTIRWLSGDKRNDLHYLLAPITKAIQIWNPADNVAIHHIFSKAVQGLTRLKSSYTSTHCSSLTAHSIDLYINLIQDILQGKKPEQLETDDSNQKTYSSFNKLWTTPQVELIYHLFQEAESNRLEQDSYLDAIENIIQTKVRCAKEILVKNMQTIL